MLRPSHLRICTYLVAATFAACAALADVTMKPKIAKLEEFEVIGIAVRTNNAKEAGPDGVIGKQWQRFMSDGLLVKIPNRADQDIYAVYTDYASDANGDYTFVIGAKVRPSRERKIPAGMIVTTIPAGNYAVFTSERGPVARVVIETWKHIWSYYQLRANGQRAYHADFELYDQRAADPNNAQVDIYIGVK
jgi:predicted transcriptional regulator YdeE